MEEIGGDRWYGTCLGAERHSGGRHRDVMVRGDDVGEGGRDDVGQGRRGRRSGGEHLHERRRARPRSPEWLPRPAPCTALHGAPGRCVARAASYSHATTTGRRGWPRGEGPGTHTSTWPPASPEGKDEGEQAFKRERERREEALCTYLPSLSPSPSTTLTAAPLQSTRFTQSKLWVCSLSTDISGWVAGVRWGLSLSSQNVNPEVKTQGLMTQDLRA